MNKYFLVLFLLISSVLSGQDKNYYVSQTDGNDSYTSEQAQNPATPWKTLGKADDLTYQPDDTIFLKRGDSWKESFEPLGSGTTTHKIVITAYGTGAKPIITGRDTISGWSSTASWTNSSGNIWYITIGSLVSKFRVWINGTEQRKAQHVTWIDATDTFADSAEVDRLYLYCVGNPATVYAGGSIESGWIRSTPVYINSVNHYKLKYLDIRGGYYSVRLRGADGIVIDSCDIGNSSTQFGLLGERIVSPVNQSDSCTVSNCLFDTDNELTSDWEVKYTENGLEVYGGNIWNIYNNTFKNWGHAGIYVLTATAATNHGINIYNNFFTAPDISYGRGLNVDCLDQNCTDLKIFRNLIRNTPVCSQINNDGTEFYYNIIDTVTDASFRPGYGAGIHITGYSGNTHPINMKFYNNVFANCNDQGIYISWAVGRNSNHDNEFINNIFYNNGSSSLYVMNSDSIYNNTFKNNIIYKNGSSTPVYYRGSTISVETFNTSDTKGDVISDNIGGNPMFDSGFELNAASPAINAGIDVGLTEDYEGKPVPYGALPDIGAYEFYDTPSPGTTTFGKTLDGLKYLKDQNGNYIKIIK